MENKNVGYLLLGISVVIAAIVFLFNNALTEIVKSSCGLAHGDSCPMFDTITQQTYLALAIVGLLVIVAVFLILTKPKEKVVVKKIKEKIKKRKIDLTGFRPEDKTLFKIIQETGTIFQSDLIEKTNFGKAKVSRILDRLEGKDLIERKRRGMVNVVVLKN